MAKIEVDEVEWNQSQQLRNVVAKIMADPKRAAKIEELRKEIEPNAPTPRLDQLKMAQEPMEALRKEFDDFRRATAEEKAKNESDAKLAALQQRIDRGNAKLLDEGWTPDGIKKLDEFREKEGILDPVAAAAYYEKLHGSPVAPMQPSSGTGAWNFMELPKEGGDFIKSLIDTKGQNDLVVENESKKILQEIRTGQRR